MAVLWKKRGRSGGFLLRGEKTGHFEGIGFCKVEFDVCGYDVQRYLWYVRTYLFELICLEKPIEKHNKPQENPKKTLYLASWIRFASCHACCPGARSLCKKVVPQGFYLKASSRNFQRRNLSQMQYAKKAIGPKNLRYLSPYSFFFFKAFYVYSGDSPKG